MISENGTCLFLSDSIFTGSSSSRDCPSFLIMDKVNVKVIPFAAPGLPVGRISSAAGMPFFLCDQKIGINALCGFYEQIECAVIFGGVNDIMWGSDDIIKNYMHGTYELAGFLRQLKIPNIVIVSPLPVWNWDENAEINGAKLCDIRTAAEWVAQLVSDDGANTYYINGYDLMPRVIENFETDGIHPNAAGRAIWVDNLITTLQVFGVFPQSYN
jgi:hypothetical protein